ncbi:zinc-ribbon domain-containing protein [Rossellomorea sp. NPDC077527]|uniref:zinc-ribbon domain-containing protein n=1 Tax=Rossellomorea sp. NPDC077527 TaxID=3364510 RepID=UPI0037C50390
MAIFLLKENKLLIDELYQVLFKDFKDSKSIDWEYYICKEKEVFQKDIMERMAEKPIFSPFNSAEEKIIGSTKFLRVWHEEFNEQLGIKPHNYSGGSQQYAVFKCPIPDSNHPPYIKQIFQVFTHHQDCPYCSSFHHCISNSFGYHSPEATRLWILEENDLTPFHIGRKASNLVTWLCGDCKKNVITARVGDYESIRFCEVCKPKNRKKKVIILGEISPRLNRFYDQTWMELKKEGSIDWEVLFFKESELKKEDLLESIKKAPQRIKGLQPLIQTHKELVEVEWNFEINNALGITPDNISAGSSQIVAFTCDNPTHPPYETKISMKTNPSTSNGCPYCHGSRRCLSNSFGYQHPYIALTWSAKNESAVNPLIIAPGNKTNFYFKCPECEKEEWLVSPNNRKKRNVCPNCKRWSQGSFAEIAFYFYYKVVYPESEKKKMSIEGNVCEIDIYVPNLRFGIDYLGEYYHKNKKADDEERQGLIRSSQIDLITIRESEKCNSYLEDKMNFVHYASKGIGSKEFHDSLDECIIRSFAYLCERGEELDLIQLRRIVNTRLDMYNILSLLLVRVENNILVTHPHLAKAWDYDTNKQLRLKPEYFTYGSNIPAFWKIRGSSSVERTIKYMCGLSTEKLKSIGYLSG